jgi:hypothetical protein
MPHTLDIGRRIELHSMDPHCSDLSLGLYRRDIGGSPLFLVHTYSGAEGSAARVDFIKRTLIVMMGLVEAPESPGWLKWPCGDVHERALKRGFLDLCKLTSDTELAPKPLAARDKKADCEMRVDPQGDGAYQVRWEEGAENGPRRGTAIARGFEKLCEMQIKDEGACRIAFPCGTDHHAMIGMLMFRAQNVRAAMQETEQAATRGVLAAPSAQE